MDQMVAGPAYTWHFSDARGTTLGIIVGPLGDKARTAAVAVAVRAVPVLLEVLQQVEAHLDEVCDGGILDRTPECALWAQVREAICLAGVLLPAPGAPQR